VWGEAVAQVQPEQAVPHHSADRWVIERFGELSGQSFDRVVFVDVDAGCRRERHGLVQFQPLDVAFVGQKRGEDPAVVDAGRVAWLQVASGPVDD
jgi:hypothetical protein